MSTAATRYAGTQSIKRAIALLKTFSDRRPEWRPHELAEANGLNLSTTYRLLASLEQEGLVVRRLGRRSYRLGPMLIALGGSALRSNKLRTVARPIMQHLAQTCGESATLEVLAGSQVIVVDETSGHHVVGMSQDVGSRLPAHATSTGKALLAHSDAEAVSVALDAPLEHITTRTITDALALKAEFHEIRRRGYAVALGELEDGFVAIAAPIFNHEGRVLAALSVGGPDARLLPERMDEVTEQVVEAARRVSAQLGHRPSWPNS